MPEKGTIESCFARIKKKKEEHNVKNRERKGEMYEKKGNNEKKDKNTVVKDKNNTENSKNTEKKQVPLTFSDIFAHKKPQKENANTCLDKRKKGVQRKKEKSVDLKNQRSIKHFLKDNDNSIVGMSQNAKRKQDNIEEINNIGTQETPNKKKSL